MADKNPRPDWVRDLGLFGVILVDVFGYSCGGLAVGYLAWKKLGFPWWVMILTAVTGLGLAMFRVVQTTRKLGSSRAGDGDMGPKK